jgi:rare lipoprotein A
LSRVALRRAWPAVLLGLTVACATGRAPKASAPSAGPPPSTGSAAAPGPGWSEEGMASWYGGDDGFEGKPTASGEIYDSSQMTAAHRELPLGTVVDVTNLDNGRSVRVRVNDRGPFLKGRVLDLSQEAARRLGVIGPGVAPVRIEIVSVGRRPGPSSNAGPWSVQIGSFSEADRAARHAKQAQAAGNPVYLEPYSGLSRVKVGPFATRGDAEAALAELEGMGFEGIVVPK